MKSVFAVFSVLISLCCSMAAYGFEEKDMLNDNEKKGGTMIENNASDNEMLVRISEIEVFPEFINEYLDFARNVGETSVREEPGVIAIFPMIQKRDSCQIRIVEIYRDNDAYRHHIGTNHFLKYKTGTLKMVKSLDLVDMFPMNADAMPAIFRKL